MSLRIRLKKLGTKGQPSFRIVACERTSRRDGREVEVLGTYNPLIEDREKQTVLDRNRTKYWLEKGAEPSKTVADILKQRGLL